MSSTPNYGLTIYDLSDSQITFNEYQSTLNGVGDGTQQNPHSAFQKIDAIYAEIDAKISALESQH